MAKKKSRPTKPSQRGTVVEIDQATARHTLRQTPIRHASLPAALLTRIQAVWDALDGSAPSATLEQWELGFMKDTHPDREVATWERIAGAFLIYREHHATPDSNLKQVVGLLCCLASNMEPVIDAAELGRLKRCLAGKP